MTALRNRLGPQPKVVTDPSRYAVSQDTFRAAPVTTSRLPAGWYDAGSDALVRKTLDVDALHDSACTEARAILEEAKAFWNAADDLQARGFNARRGLLLYGPPGTGKTSLTTLLAAKAIAELDAIVVTGERIDVLESALALIRSREERRPILVILEDIEEIYDYQSSGLLSLLDGHRKIDRVFTVATTNKLGKLDGRLINRPGRFDRVIEIGPPNEDARRAFLELTAPELSDEERTQWVAQSAGWSIAHLRELVISVFGLRQDAVAVFERLNKPPSGGSPKRKQRSDNPLDEWR